MGNGQRLLVGTLVGGALGWVLGNILADHFFPEYYTEEEMEEYRQNLVEYVAEDLGDVEGKTLTVNLIEEKKKKETQMGKKKLPKDYTAMFEGEKGKKAQELVRKFNDPDYVEVNLAEEIKVEEFEIEDESITLDYPTYYDSREKENTYLLESDAFEENESGFKQATLYYYPEDDVLTDAKDKPVESIERVVGDEALSNFGTYSEDPDVVYVANRKLKYEYEVINQRGSYNWKVLGIDPADISPPSIKKANIFDELDEE